MQKVTEYDITRCRRYEGPEGKRNRFVMVNEPDGGAFYTVLDEDTGVTYSRLGYPSFRSKKELAKLISEVPDSHFTHFVRWLDR